MKKELEKYILYLAVLLLASCANIVTPSGGLKDWMPPKALRTNPEMNARNFTGRSVRIEFDEFVKVTDASNQVVVSPFMSETPDIKLKGKSIVVEFLDTLKPNTTYTVSFGTAISDIAENNILSNYRYAFSTGSEFDTLMLKGVVKNAFTLKPENGLFVMLYAHTGDSAPCKGKPLYVSKTTSSGEFCFANVKDGKYKIFALKDMNANYLFDQPNEKVAFIDSLVSPNTVDTSKSDSLGKSKIIELFLFEKIPSVQRIIKASPVSYGKLMFVFRKPVQNITFTPFANTNTPFRNLREINTTKDTVILWMKDPDLDSVSLLISDNNVILDTSEIALIKKDALKKGGRGKSDYKNIQIKPNASARSAFDFYKPLTIECSTPVAQTEFGKIVLKEGNDTIKPAFVFTDSIKRKIRADYKWKEKTAYSLFIPPGTFNDIFGTANDTVKIDFKTSAAEDYGNVKLTLKFEALNCNHIVQLVTENDVVIQEKYCTANETLNFNYILPGNYRFKLIYDANNDNKWDTGDYFNKLQPERVYYYPSSIQVRSNWEMETDWEVKNK